MYCLNCGTKIPDGEQACSICGTAVMTVSQPTAEPETANSAEETEIAAEGAVINDSEAIIMDETESSPRLYQEPIAAPSLEAIPEPNAAPYEAPSIPPVRPQYQQNPNQVQYQQIPSQPQYQQMPNQIQYQQLPNQPQYQQMPIPLVQPIITLPFMKRKEFFKSPAAEKIRGKLDLLNILTGMGFGAVMVCFFCVLSVLFAAIYAMNNIRYYDFRISETDVSTAFAVSIAALLLLALFGVFCIIGIKTKHFGFYIPLLLPSLFLTTVSAITLITLIDNPYFSIDFVNEVAYYFMIVTVIAIFSVIALVLSVISLVLSIIVSNKYKNAQREYIWKATNKNL